MQTSIITATDVSRWVQGVAGYTQETVIFLGGDRISCCDEAAAVSIKGMIVAVATIAPQGEEQSGVPTIVGLYTLPGYRQQHYGKLAFEGALRRCIERGFERVRVDVLSPHVHKIISSLSAEMRERLEVVDQGPGLSALGW